VKKIINILGLMLIILVLSSCGSSSTQEGDNAPLANNIDVVNCDGSGTGLNDCVNFTCIKKGDTLVSNSNNTVLEIIHNSNNSKKVCVKQTTPAGSAKIIR